MDRADESLRKRLEEERGRLIVEVERLLETTMDIETLMRFPSIVVRGDPGGGKSTLTRYITWAAATGRTKLVGEEAAARLPLCIRAIEFGEALENGRVDSLDEYLADESGRFAPLVKHALATGQALVLIDGLDEVGNPALRARVKERVDDFIADPAFAGNQIVITTRIVGYERSGLTGRFSHFTLAELNDEQIADFVNSWYGAIHDEMPAAIDVQMERQQLLEAIMGNESIHHMARNPLLLTIIALIKWQGRALPEQRVLLYDAAAQTLIRSWPLTQRRVELDELFIREWLAPVALRVFADGTSDLIDEYSLMEELVASMRRLKSMTKIGARQASQELLEDVSLHSGILLPRGTDEDGRNLYGFLHQTFAEYLTAYHLAGRWEDGELNLIEYAHDPYWREVLLLMAGHLGTQRRAKAGRFIEAIRNLHSSPYEDVIHRDLLLAGRILGDGVPAGPGDLIESLLRESFQLWQETPIHALRVDIADVFGDLRTTEYAAVLARLARGSELNASQTLTLARQLGPDHFVDALVELLSAEDPEVRVDAARLLAERDDPRGVEILAELLDTKDLRVRVNAARLLVERDDHRGVEALAELLDHEDPFARVESITLLVARGDPRALKTMAKIIGSTPGIFHDFLVGMLLPEPPDPLRLGTLAGLLGTEEPRVRLGVARVLAERDDARGVDALVALLDTEDLGVRVDAARLLVERDDYRGVDALAELLEAEDPKTRIDAARLLAERDDPRGVEVLVELLGIEDPRVRYQAARLLAERDDARGVDALVALLDTEDLGVRVDAARLLVERDDYRGVDALAELLEAEDPKTHIDAARLLAERDDPRGVEALVELLSTEDPRVRYEAARLLAKRDDPRGVEVLVELLGVEDPMVRGDAARLLAERKDPEIVVALVDLLGAEESRARYEAAWVLCQREDTLALQTIQGRLESMLKDVATVPEQLMGRPYVIIRSRADIAYRFLKQHLSPFGELQPSIEEPI